MFHSLNEDQLFPGITRRRRNFHFFSLFSPVETKNCFGCRVSAEKIILQFGLRIRILRAIKSMKITFWMAVFSLATATSLLADDANVLSDAQSRASYAVGMMIGERWKQQGIDLNDDVFLRGLRDAKTGTNTLMTDKEMSDTLNQFQQTLMAKQQQMRAELGEKNKAEGATFLASNTKNPGVITLPDGLQYKVLTEGTGRT